MSEIVQLQNDFVHGIFKNDFKQIGDLIRVNGAIESRDRLEVHRQTILLNLVNALKITYPGIWQIIGEECAEGIALSYLHEINHIPKNGGMINFGMEFPDYLANLQSIKHLEYLPNFAELEWAKAKCYHARINNAVPLTELENLSEQELAESVFTLNKSVMLISSVYPLHLIQNMLDNANSEPVTLIRQQSFYVIFQKDGKVITTLQKFVNWRFLEEINLGKKFGKIVEKFEDEEEFKLIDIIQFMLKNKIIESRRR